MSIGEAGSGDQAASGSHQRIVERALMQWSDELTGRVAVITGGARGIGQCIGDALTRAGVKVVAADKSWDGAEDFKKQLESSGGLALEVDITNDGQLDAAYDEVMAQFGTLLTHPWS